jgi:hypothetical protein
MPLKIKDEKMHKQSGMKKEIINNIDKTRKQ